MNNGTKPGEDWRRIPGLPDKFELSNLGRVRVWYKYKGHLQQTHFRVLKPDGNQVSIMRKKYNIPLLLQTVFGYSYCDDRAGEQWKDVMGYEDLYQVSNLGRIKSKPKYVKRKDGRVCYQHERFIKYSLINSGYYRVCFHKEQVTKTFLVHRVVAEHFIPNPNKYEQVNHKNEDKTDNRASNLEWCSQAYNAVFGTSQERRIATRLKNNNGKYGVSRKNTRSAGIEK